MAIQHLENAALEPLHATAKLVLMAIADDANRETRIAYPGMAKMSAWADCSEERVTAILQELIARQLVARRSKGRRGRRTEYIVFPTPEELDRLDTIDPTLNHVSEATFKRVHKQDEKRALAAETTSDQAVESGEESPSPVRPFPGVRVSPGMPQTLTGEAPPVSTPGSIPQSVTDRHQIAVESVDRPTKFQPHPQRRAGRPLDVIEVTTSQASLFEPTGISEAGIERLCLEVLSKASSTVLDPTAYVIGTLRRDRIEWQARAFELAAEGDFRPEGLF